jgi:hypothetical protein
VKIDRMQSTVAIALMLAAIQPYPFEAALIGTWSGTLEYRDYRSERRVTLPTTLVIKRLGDGALTFAYTYDDGPGKTVTAQDRITIDSAKQTFRIQNADGSYDATFAVTDFAASGADGHRVVLTGKGEENKVAVDLRITITVTPASFTMLRESRQPGEEFLFRNRYEMKRQDR